MSGALILQLYQLRTEPALRNARAWFAFEFHPRSAQDILRAWLGPGQETSQYRMVTTYWDMACGLVVHGEITPELFNSVNTEHIALWSKLRPFIQEVRAATNYLDYLGNIEQVIVAMPDSEARVGIFERYMKRQADYSAKQEL
jgi:hypothetical protein